jgi:hypothetical protein
MYNRTYLIYLTIITMSLLISASCESDSKPNNARTHPLDSNPSSIIVDHLCRDIDAIPQAAIEQAKSTLHIAYGHTSHGSQLVDGMTGLVAFKGALYSWNDGGTGGALDLRDKPSPLEGDLGSNSSWAADTRSYLNDHPDVNVIIWSWCGQVSSASEDDIIVYLSQMTALESDYPGVKFVYMTGHLDGYGLTGNLHLRNEQIRAYCRAQNKILYDFADIESYDPDGAYFGDKDANDNCDYDGDGDNQFDGNWAIEWQTANPGEWYNCTAAHTQPLNGNLKAYAAWWLWARLAGWEGPR